MEEREKNRELRFYIGATPTVFRTSTREQAREFRGSMCDKISGRIRFPNRDGKEAVDFLMRHIRTDVLPKSENREKASLGEPVRYENSSKIESLEVAADHRSALRGFGPHALHHIPNPLLIALTFASLLDYWLCSLLQVGYRSSTLLGVSRYQA